jgi:hypothetical protein
MPKLTICGKEIEGRKLLWIALLAPIVLGFFLFFNIELNEGMLPLDYIGPNYRFCGFTPPYYGCKGLWIYQPGLFGNQHGWSMYQLVAALFPVLWLLLFLRVHKDEVTRLISRTIYLFIFFKFTTLLLSFLDLCYLRIPVSRAREPGVIMVDLLIERIFFLCGYIVFVSSALVVMVLLIDWMRSRDSIQQISGWSRLLLILGIVLFFIMTLEYWNYKH